MAGRSLQKLNRLIPPESRSIENALKIYVLISYLTGQTHLFFQKLFLKMAYFKVRKVPLISNCSRPLHASFSRKVSQNQSVPTEAQAAMLSGQVIQH